MVMPVIGMAALMSSMDGRRAGEAAPAGGGLPGREPGADAGGEPCGLRRPRSLTVLRSPSVSLPDPTPRKDDPRAGAVSSRYRICTPRLTYVKVSERRLGRRATWLGN